MDNESIVYGCIKHLPISSADASASEALKSYAHNRRVIARLPGMDDGWPFLCRDMFSVPGPDVFTGQYQTQVIHFGMSYRAVEYEWEQWLQKFEALLKQMYWVSSVVHLETTFSGNHTFYWNSVDDDGHEPSDQPLQVRCEWSREGALA